ncbi:MAG: hypothetical protein QM607_07165 [Microbacterium sp.]
MTWDVPWTAAVALSRTPDGTTVAFDDQLPPLRDAVRDEVRARFGIDIHCVAGGVDPLAQPSFAQLIAQLRVEQVVRTLSRRTNRSLAGTRVAVVGGGILAEAVRDAAVLIGARVRLVTDDASWRLRTVVRGQRAVSLAALTDLAAEHVIATGEGHPPLAALPAGATAIDASFAGTGIAPGGQPSVRQGVLARDGAWIVAAPPLWPDTLDAEPAQLRAVDAFVALALALVTGAEADRRFAEAVLA